MLQGLVTCFIRRSPRPFGEWGENGKNISVIFVYSLFCWALYGLGCLAHTVAQQFHCASPHSSLSHCLSLSRRVVKSAYSASDSECRPGSECRSPRHLDRPFVWIAPSFRSLRRLDRSVVWIAPSFESHHRLDRSVVWIALSLFGSLRHFHRSVVCIAPSFGSLHRLDRSIVWIAPLFGTIRQLDCSVVWIALSFGSLRRDLDRSVVCNDPSFRSLRRLDRPVVWIAPSFGSLRRLHCSVALIAPFLHPSRVTWIAMSFASFGSLRR